MVTAAVSTVLSHKSSEQGGSGSPSAGPRQRPPLLPSESGNVVATRLPKGRDVNSRYLSSISGGSPVAASAMKRSQSVERRQAVTPPSNLLDLKTGTGAREKVLFTSARSLAVSFQGSSFSLQVSKKKSSPLPSNVRRGTPERRKPAAANQGHGPEYADRSGKIPGSTGNVIRAMNDTVMLASLCSYIPDSPMKTKKNSVRRSDLQSESSMDSDTESPIGSTNGTPKLISKKSGFESPSFSPKGPVNNRRYPSPAHREVWPASPSKLPNPALSLSTPARNAGTGLPSILCFAADLRSGRIGENRVADAHELRLLYNRLLQWRFVNARADSALCAQESDALWGLSSARFVISRLRNSVKWKKMELQSRRHKLKLASLLRWQMVCLEAWDSMDRNYSDSLSGAVESLQASTLRLPVVDGARVEVQKVKDAVCSADDVMQSVLQSTSSLSTKVEEVNSVVGELIHAATQEGSLLNQSSDLLSTIASMRAMECSLRTQILQLTHQAPPMVSDT